MCEKVCSAVRENPGSFISAISKLTTLILDKDDPAYYFQGKRVTTNPDELCSQILYTCYMGTVNSSEFTKSAAGDLATQISSNHSR